MEGLVEGGGGWVRVASRDGSAGVIDVGWSMVVVGEVAEVTVGVGFGGLDLDLPSLSQTMVQ